MGFFLFLVIVIKIPKKISNDNYSFIALLYIYQP